MYTRVEKPKVDIASCVVLYAVHIQNNEKKKFVLSKVELDSCSATMDILARRR